MNELLFMLWMGDIAAGLAPFFGITGWVLTIVSVIVSGYIRIELGKPVPGTAKTLICMGTALVFLAALIPSKQFFYIAAGGTAAVQALDTEIGKKVAKLVELKLDEALGETK